MSELKLSYEQYAFAKDVLWTADACWYDDDRDKIVEAWWTKKWKPFYESEFSKSIDPSDALFLAMCQREQRKEESDQKRLRESRTTVAINLEDALNNQEKYTFSLTYWDEWSLVDPEDLDYYISQWWSVKKSAVIRIWKNEFHAKLVVYNPYVPIESLINMMIFYDDRELVDNLCTQYIWYYIWEWTVENEKDRKNILDDMNKKSDYINYNIYDDDGTAWPTNYLRSVKRFIWATYWKKLCVEYIQSKWWSIDVDVRIDEPPVF